MRYVLSLSRRPLSFSAALAVLVAAAGVAVDVSKEEGRIEARHLLPLEQRSRQFIITEGEKEGEKMRLMLEPTDDDRWRLQLGTIAELGLERSEEGAILVHRIVLPDENKAIEFASPLVFITSSIRPNVSVTERTRARVINTKESEVTRSGPVTHTLHEVLLKKFHTPVESYDGVLVRIDETLTVDMAELRIEFSAGFVPKQGIVSSSLTYTVDKPLWFGTTKTHVAELAEPLMAKAER